MYLLFMTDNTVAKAMTGQNANRTIIERRAATEEDKINQIQAILIKLTSVEQSVQLECLSSTQ